MGLVAGRRAKRRRRLLGGSARVVAASLVAASPAGAGPQGGVVRGGDASIVTNGPRTTIRQNSDRVVIDWRSFDIDEGEAVRFLQPGKSAIALNRVLDGLPTNIRGQLLANGNVWIVNRHGVVFHAGALADVGGLLATTADISNADFMAGNYRFDRPGAPDAKIVNEGEITFGEAGLAAFVAPGVENRGVIAGRLGKVVIAGAETFAIDLAGDGFMAFPVAGGGAKAATSGRIYNPGGHILITAASAQGLVESQISVGGVVEARTAEMKEGRIVLSGDGAVEVTGALDATGRGAGETGGAFAVTGRTVHVAEGASIDVSGVAGGGAAMIGGGPKAGGLPEAKRVLVEKGATIRADATGRAGDGGEIVLWSGEATAFGGALSARGGAKGGDGGFAEISSAGLLRFTGAADLAAPSGAEGLLLLDPTNIAITAAGDDDAEFADGEILFGDLSGDDFTLSAAALSAVTADVVLQASNDITVDAAVSTAFGLTLQAGRDIVLNANVSAAALTLAADFDFSGLAGPAADGVGTIRFSGGGLSGAGVALSAGEALTLGDVAATGDLSVATTGDAIAQSGGAALSVGGALSLSGSDIALAADGPLALGPVAASGTLALSATGAITQSTGAITASGAASVTARDGGARFALTLDAAANNFASLALDGGAVTIRDANALVLGAVDASTLSVTAGGAITQTSPLSVSGAAAFAAQSGGTRFDVALANAANSFGGAVALTGANVDITDNSSLALGAVTATTLDAVAAGAITQSAGATVTDASSFTAQSGGTRFALTLSNAANDFGGAVALIGDAVTIRDANALVLGATTAASLNVITGGAVTQTAALSVSGNAAVAAQTGGTRFNVTLANAANAFGGEVDLTGAAVSIRAAGALTLGPATATTLTAQAGGAIDQAAALSVSGAASFTAQSGATRFDVTLTNAANEFGGAVALTGANVDLTDATAIALGAVTATTLDVAAGGAITQTAGATVAGGSSFTAQSGGSRFAITLSNAANDFGGAAALTGGAVTIRDANALTLGAVDATSLNVTAGGAVTQSAALSVTGAAAVTAQSGATRFDVTLTNLANEFGGALALTGANVDVTDASALALGAVTATTLDVTAAGAITQTAGATVTGAATFAADSGGARFAVTLDNAANDFGGPVDARGAAISLRDANALALRAIDGTTLTARAGTSLTDTSGAQIAATGAASFIAGTDVILDNDGAGTRLNVGGALSASGRDITLIAAGAVDAGAIAATRDLTLAARGGAIADGASGAVTVGRDADLDAAGAILLDNAGNAFAGDVTFRADAAATIRASGGLAVTDSLAGGNVTLTASGGALSVAELSGGAVLGVASGAVSASDISADALTLGGLGSTVGAAAAATGAVSVDGAIIGAGGVSAASGSEVALRDLFTSGAIAVRAPVQRYVYVRSDALASGAITDFNAGIAGAAADIDLLTLDRMSFGGDIAAAAGEIRFGFLRTLSGGDLVLTGLTGDIAKLADAAIDYAGAAGSGTSVALPRSAATASAPDAAGAFSDLVNAGGDIRIDAAGFAGLTRGFDPGSAAHHVRLGGRLDLAAASAAVETAEGLVLGATDVTGDAALRFNADSGPGAGETLSQGSGQTLRVGGRLSVISGVHGGALDGAELGDVTLANAGNRLGDVRLIARSATLRDDDGFSISGGALSGALAIGSAGTPQAGAVSVTDLAAGGAVSVTAAGAVTLTRVSVGASGAGALTVASGGALAARDVRAAGAASLDAGAAGTVERFSFNGLGVDAAGALTLRDGNAGALTATAGAGATLANLSLSQGDVTAAGALSLDAVRASGAFDGAGASVSLGTLAIGGALTLDAVAGSISLAASRNASPGAVAVAGPGALSFGLTDADTSLAVTDTLAAGAGATLSRTAFTRRIDVSGVSDLAAAGSILLPREAAELHNRFAGAVTLDAGAAASVATQDALTLAASDVGGALTLLTNSDNSDSANGLTQTGALTVGGALSISTGDHGGAPIASASILGDVTLTESGNRFGGAVSVVADDAALASQEGFTVSSARLGGALTADVFSNAASAALSASDVEAAGAATLRAGGRVTLNGLTAGGALTAESRAEDVSATGVIAGATTLTAADDVTLTTATLSALALDAADVATISGLAASGALSVEAATLSLDGASAGTTNLQISGAATLDALASGSTTIAAGSLTYRNSTSSGSISATVGAAATISSLDIAGGLSLSAGAAASISDVDVGGALTAASTGGDVTASDIASGAAALTASGALTLTDASLGAATIAAGGAATLADVGASGSLALASGGEARLTRVTASGSLSATSTGGDLIGLNLTAGGATLAAAGDLTLTNSAFGATEIDAGGAATITGLAASGALGVEAETLALAGARAGATTLAITGGAGVSDLDAGPTTISTGSLTLRDSAISGRFAATVGGAAALTELSVSGVTRIAVGARLSLDDFDLRSVSLLAGGAANLSDGAARDLGLVAGGDAALVNLRLLGLDAEAGGGLSLDAATIAADARLLARAGDLGLGAAAVGGDLTAAALAGDVFTRDSDLRMRRVEIGRPGGGAGAVLAAADLAGLLDVAGETHVFAAGDIALVDDAIGVRADNDFQGGVTAIAGGSVMLNDRNDLLIGASNGVAIPGGGRFDMSGVRAGGSLRVEAGGTIRDAGGAPRARLDVAGDALFIAGDDILIDNGVHAIGGAVAAFGRNVTLSEAGSVDLGPVRARGDLAVLAGARGATGDAAIRQVGSVDVADAEAGLPAAAAAAPARRAGAIVVFGAADFATGLDARRGLGAAEAGADRSLVLDNARNAFGGVISLRRIAGNATLVEESAAGAAGFGAARQDIANWEVGGSTRLVTTDGLVFLGRLTSLGDEVFSPARLARPDEIASRRQGEAGLGRDLLRLGLGDGTSFAIDTTGAGFAPAGAPVRFDRPVDGLNDLPSVGSPSIGPDRANLGALTINAGRTGEVRFRDFVGAIHPLGPTDITGGSFLAGVTFAEALPPDGPIDLTPASRFLFDAAAPDDYFFVGGLRINVSNRLMAYTPPGQVDVFVNDDAYFGVNTPSFVFGDVTAPALASAFGFIVNTRQRAGGLFPIPPSRSPEFQFNDCVVGDVSDCTNIPVPNVVNQVLIVAPPVLDIDEQELLELFGSFGNEELWGVPQSFLSDFVNTDAPCGLGQTC